MIGQNFISTKQAFTAAVVLTVALSGVVSPRASAQDIDQPHPENCAASNEEKPVQIPYSYISTAESMIADGTIDDEVVNALEGVEVNYEIVGPAPRALPAVAAAAVAVTAWCVKGAVGSLAPSAIQQIAHAANDGIEPPSWVMNAIFGCAGGPVLGALTTQTMRVKFAGAVLAAVIKLRNFG
ncbi:hypothetical protein L2121_11425 [Corynebacterium diphtheriae bv. mitis]|jgi:hypothetical protein|nr:hypothetical protein [Corynebacterium sp.]MCM0144788.1 hypothetical protein [Corynebacterium diphtheriae bv. mitis]